MKTSQHSLKKEIPNFKKWEKDLKHLIKDNKQLSKGTSHQYVHHNKILQKCKL
jgi:sulfur transfer protein SufE